MLQKTASVLAVLIASITLTYYGGNQEKVNPPSSSLEQQNVIVKVESEPKAEHDEFPNISPVSQREEFLFTSAVPSLSGSLPLQNVFIILLFHTFKVDSVAAVCAETFSSVSIWGIFEVGVFGLPTLYSKQKWNDNTTPEMDQESMLKWSLISGAVGLVIGFLIAIAIFCLCKWKKQRQPRDQDTQGRHDEQHPSLLHINPAETENREITTIETEGNMSKEPPKHEQKERVDKLQLYINIQTEVRNILEDQKLHLEGQLKEFETKLTKNKEQLQSVESKLTEEQSSEDRDSLIKQKEGLLQDQWKLDEKIKSLERQILNVEKALEPIEIGMNEFPQ